MIQQHCIKLRLMGQEFNSAIRSNFLYDFGHPKFYAHSAVLLRDSPVSMGNSLALIN